MGKMEVIVVVFVLVWWGLATVEGSAHDGGRFRKHAWLARALLHIAWSYGMGVFLFVIGTDWRNPFWERTIGAAIMILGSSLSLRVFVRRKAIQEALESGKLTPFAE